MTTYYFLVDDHSDEVVIASIEADSPKAAFALLQPFYDPFSLLWLPNYEERSEDATGSGREEVSPVSGRA